MNDFGFTLNFLLSLILAVACLYTWAALWFLFFRFSRAESEGRLRRFLADHFEFYTFRFSSAVSDRATLHDVAQAGSRGWWMLGLPLATINFSMDLKSILLANAILFFGGMMFAYSWYGQRCMKLLNIDSFPHQDTAIS